MDKAKVKELCSITSLSRGSVGLKPALKSVYLEMSSHRDGAVYLKMSSKDFSSVSDSLRTLFNDL